MNLINVENKRLAILSLMLGNFIGLLLLGAISLLFLIALGIIGYINLPTFLLLIGASYCLPTFFAAIAIFLSIKREMLKEQHHSSDTSDEENDRLVDDILRAKLGDKADSLLKK